MDKARETELVARCQRGDRKAMEVLLTQYEKPVFNAAYRMLGNADDAADITQSVFLKVFENIGQFNPAHRFFSWIYRIAVNESIDQLKRRKPTQSYDDNLAAGDDTPHAATANEQRDDQLQAALQELSPEHRAVLVLRYFTDCDYRRIGETLDIPEQTVKSRLFTARRQLRLRLRRHGVTSA